MALEHFVGDCLETVLSREERLDLPAALNTARHLVRALSALHAAGTLHGDLRPLNVLVSPDGEKVLIADLCSAASRDGGALVFGSPMAEGRWAYVSPEQTGRMNGPSTTAPISTRSA